MFDDPLKIIVAIAVLVVALILARGISTFGRSTGVEHAREANKWMRYRIYAQAVAVVIIMLAVYLGR